MVFLVSTCRMHAVECLVCTLIKGFCCEKTVRAIVGIIMSLSLPDCQGMDPRTALIIIDVQNCFTDGGTLAVADGNQVIPVINEIRRDYGSHFDLTVQTQDWHCADHVSFASQHPGYHVYDTIDLYYDSQGDLCHSVNITNDYTVNCTDDAAREQLVQVLWPDHCVINTSDAQIHDELTTASGDIIVRKGYKCDLDSYSAFFGNGGYGKTELHELLQDQGINRLVITGLATDFCVYSTAKDAMTLAYDTYVVVDATRGVAADTTEAAISDMRSLGVKLINATDVGEVFDVSSSVNLLMSLCAVVAALIIALTASDL